MLGPLSVLKESWLGFRDLNKPVILVNAWLAEVNEGLKTAEVYALNIVRKLYIANTCIIIINVKNLAVCTLY